MASSLQITWEDSNGVELTKQFDRPVLFVGSGLDADVQIVGRGLESLHLELRADAGDVQLREVGGSEMAATVDGEVLPRAAWRALSGSHEVLLLGRVKLRVEVTKSFERRDPVSPQMASPAPVALHQRQETEPLPSKSRLRTGQLIAHYRIERMLGEGGMGAVYEATHVRMNAKRFAIKILLAEAASLPNAEARFFREAEAISRLEHPHVVNVIDFGKHDDVTYIVMEKLEGEDLAGRILRGRVPAERACDIMLAVASAVQAAHDLGILHRDLKPANIFLARTSTGDNIPKVLDFGISKFGGSQQALPLTAASMLLGTPHYMSPEQATGAQGGDAISDQYALAAIVYECLTGQRVHQAENLFGLLRAIASNDPVAISSFLPDVPPNLEAVIMRGLSRDPRDRFESVHAFGKALLPFASAKHKAFWTDFYGRKDLQQTSSGFDAIPLTASTYRAPQEEANLPSTKLLPGSGDPSSGRFDRQGLPQGLQNPPSDHDSATKGRRKRASRVALLILAGASVGSASWVLLTRTEKAPAQQEGRVQPMVEPAPAAPPEIVVPASNHQDPPKVSPPDVQTEPKVDDPIAAPERQRREARRHSQSRHRRSGKAPEPVQFNESGIPILR